MRVYTVDVFGGDTISRLGIFSSKRAAEQVIAQDFAKLPYDEHMLKLANDADTGDFDFVMYAVPKADPDISLLDASADLCLQYNVASYILDEVINEEVA